jgi:putative DNA primase/helicase
MDGYEYIILNEHKQATHQFKEGGKSWDEVKDFDNIARIVPEPFIVLDFDTESDAKIMLDIIEGEDLKCKVMKTTRGIHCYFRSDEPWKCFKKERLACGIYCDCKSHSKNAYTVIRQNGKDREWIRDCKDDEVMEVPAFLRPLKCGNMFSFKGMSEGDGRNQELFNYIMTLQSRGFKKKEVIDTLNVINAYVFDDALSENEMRSIYRDEAFMSDEEVVKNQITMNKFSHSKFAKMILADAKNHIIYKNNQFYIYDDGYYKEGYEIINKRMVTLYEDIKRAQKAETFEYLSVQCRVDDVKLDKYVINLNNCRLNVYTGETTDHDPMYMDFNRIPVTYDKNAKCEAVDMMIDKVFSHDKEVIQLFYEMLGSCLIRHSKYQKAFILVGGGSNGKSTILDMIMTWIGRENYSTIDITELCGNRFAPAGLENKMVNIGDDCNTSMLKNTGIIKKIFAGQEIRVEKKGQDGYNITPYATHIFSSNSLIKSVDKSDGYYRRFIFLPMMATFSSKDKDYDPMIEEKVTTDEAMSHLLNLALKGARRLIRDGKFLEPKAVQEMLEEYKIENTSSLRWVEDKKIDLDHCLNTPKLDLYNEYKSWAEQNGEKNVSGSNTFYNDIRKKFGLAKQSKQQKKDGKRYFVLDLDD